MDPSELNSILTEVSISLSYVAVIFIFQVGAFFIKLWNDDRKQQVSNVLILSYGVFFLLFSLGGALYAFISVPTHVIANFTFYFLLSLMIRGIGGIVLSMVMEWQIFRRTKYVISLIFIILLLILPFLINYTIFNVIALIINLLLMALPIIFSLHFIKQTSGDVRRKLMMGLIGFIFTLGGLMVSSHYIVQAIESTFAYPGFILFPSILVIIAGCVIIIYGFHGFSLYLESEWKANLISLHIIDKTRTVELYHETFAKVEDEVVKEDIFAGGIAGVVKVIKEFWDSKKDVDIINLRNNFILLSHGEKIISALLVKKELQHAKQFLKSITIKFEYLFWDYLKSFDSYQEVLTPLEVFKPMKMLIRDIIKF